MQSTLSPGGNGACWEAGAGGPMLVDKLVVDRESCRVGGEIVNGIMLRTSHVVDRSGDAHCRHRTGRYFTFETFDWSVDRYTIQHLQHGWLFLSQSHFVILH